ncbi:unnamed protein product [Pichia kudriavzevii]
MEHQEIVATYKKEGHFDERRKEWFELLANDGPKKEKLYSLIKEIVQCKIERDPDLLTRNKGKVAALIQTEMVKAHVHRQRLRKGPRISTGTTSEDITTSEDTTTSSSTRANTSIVKDRETELLELVDTLLDEVASDAQRTLPVEFKDINA